MKKIILIGGGGHCKSVLQGLKRSDAQIAGIIDVEARRGDEVLGVPIIGADDDLLSFPKDNFEVIITVGSVKKNRKRKKLYDQVKSLGFKMAVFVSDRSMISEDIKVGMGTVILDGVIVNASSRIGENCIINTGSIVEHDCRIGNHVHIAPGAVVSGEVIVGDMAFIGAGSVIKHAVKIGEGATIASGAVVIEDIPSNVTVAGIPAKIIH